MMGRDPDPVLIRTVEQATERPASGVGSCRRRERLRAAALPVGTALAGRGNHDWCVVVCHSDEEWQRLVQVMGSPSWASPPKFATLAGRLQHQEELDEQIEK